MSESLMICVNLQPLATFSFFLFYGRAALIFSEKHLISFCLFCNACILPLALERLFMFPKHIVVMLPCCKKSNASPW